MSQIHLDTFPNEIREEIYKHLVQICVKGKEFKAELQTVWFKHRIDRLVCDIFSSSEVYKDIHEEQVLYDVDELDLEPYTRSKFHQCLKHISSRLVPNRLKTRWMFLIFGYDDSILEYLNAHIGQNYLRGYITYDGYLFGYLLLVNNQQNLQEILGKFSYPWPMDCLLLNRIEEYFNRFQTMSVGNHQLRADLLHKKVILRHKSTFSDNLIEGCLENMIPDIYLPLGYILTNE